MNVGYICGNEEIWLCVSRPAGRKLAMLSSGTVGTFLFLSGNGIEFV